MMRFSYVRSAVSTLVLICLLTPFTVFAMADGKKHFNEGLKYETSEQWDKAVEEFALAITENPKSPEYRLHYQRSLFNASQMYMKRGNAAAAQKDYAGGYNAYRKAYAYDPVNELAKSEMDRMLRLQQGMMDENKTDDKKDESGLKLIPTGFKKDSPDFVMPQKLEKLRDVPFPAGVDLQWLIKELSKDLDLNVIFDTESRLDTRKVKIELKNVTAARALDYIFLQESLFFQKIGPRTILVATNNRRQNFQQLVLRTFYLGNADPEKVKATIQQAIPAQPGRTPTIVLTDKDTNSLTVRDTEENIRLIGKLIDSLDKDRAEVVMDVAIYEVSKSDLLKLGNQIGNDIGSSSTNELNNLGGSNSGVIKFNGNLGSALAQSIASGIILPSTVISAFQSKTNTKLLASTQIHAFNNEDSSARIGQRVPVRSASFAPVGGTTPGTTNNFVGDVINYEQVGLTLKFKPIVFPNQDVQVAMEIESKDVAGATTLTPTFTERTIKGTARVQNNKTLLLASVAQDVESNGRAGLPFLGGLPLVGRLFSTPTKDNRRVDIVIAVTPRVLRAPAILPDDLIERPTGSLATPTSNSLEAMIVQEEYDEQLATARRLGNSAKVQLPDRKADDAPNYVKNDSAKKETGTETAETKIDDSTVNADGAKPETASADTTTAVLKPIDAGVKTLNISSTSDTFGNRLNTKETTLNADGKSTAASPRAELRFLSAPGQMKAGEKTKLAVMIQSAIAFRSAVIGMKFDATKVAVRGVSFGDVFGAESAQAVATPFLNQNGKMYVSLAASKDTAGNSSGVLAFVEIEALADGTPQLAFDSDVLSLLTADGKNFELKY
jgi:general secretion pathway protein D